MGDISVLGRRKVNLLFFVILLFDNNNKKRIEIKPLKLHIQVHDKQQLTVLTTHFFQKFPKSFFQKRLIHRKLLVLSKLA